LRTGPLICAAGLLIGFTIQKRSYSVLAFGELSFNPNAMLLVESMRKAIASSQRYSESLLFVSVREARLKRRIALSRLLVGDVKLIPDALMTSGVWKKLKIDCVALAICPCGYWLPPAVSWSGPAAGSAALLRPPELRGVQKFGIVSLLPSEPLLK